MRMSGPMAIFEMIEKFQELEREGSRLLDRPSFEYIMSKFNHSLSPQELDDLFNYIQDPNKPGRIDYNIIVKDIRGNELNYVRKGLVKDIFYKLNFKNDKTVDMRLLSDIFYAKDHPDVMAGKTSANAVETQFKKVVNSYIHMNGDNPIMNYDMFYKFWEYISSTYPIDNHFEFMMLHCFYFKRLPKKGAHIETEVDRFERRAMNIKEIDISKTVRPSDSWAHSILDEIQVGLAKEGPIRFFELFAALRKNDYDGDLKITSKEFLKTFKDIRLIIEDDKLLSLFKGFDPRGTNYIGIPHFMCTFVPELNLRRQKPVAQLLDQLSEEYGSKVVPYESFKASFVSSQHPEVRSGIKSDRRVQEDFNWILKTFLHYSGGVHSTIPREVINQLFDLIGMAYNDDESFVEMVTNSFRPESRRVANRANSSTNNRADYHHRPSTPVNSSGQKGGYQGKLGSSGREQDAINDSPSHPSHPHQRFNDLPQSSPQPQSNEFMGQGQIASPPKNIQEVSRQLFTGGQQPQPAQDQPNYTHTHPYQRRNIYQESYNSANKRKDTSVPLKGSAQKEEQFRYANEPNPFENAVNTSNDPFLHTHPYLKTNNDGQRRYIQSSGTPGLYLQTGNNRATTPDANLNRYGGSGSNQKSIGEKVQDETVHGESVRRSVFSQ